MVVYDHNRAALLVSDRPQLHEQRVRFRLVHPGRRLVEQEQPRPPRERPRDLGAALLAVGEHARRPRCLVGEPRTGQELEVEDERLRGRRRVSFTPADDGVEIGLSLEYELKATHALTWAVDLVSVRPNVAASLRRTVARFAREREADLEWAADGSR